jgi:hypothetical protein
MPGWFVLQSRVCYRVLRRGLLWERHRGPQPRRRVLCVRARLLLRYHRHDLQNYDALQARLLLRGRKQRRHGVSFGYLQRRVRQVVAEQLQAMRAGVLLHPGLHGIYNSLSIRSLLPGGDWLV